MVAVLGACSPSTPAAPPPVDDWLDTLDQIARARCALAVRCTDDRGYLYRDGACQPFDDDYWRRVLGGGEQTLDENAAAVCLAELLADTPCWYTSFDARTHRAQRGREERADRVRLPHGPGARERPGLHPRPAEQRTVVGGTPCGTEGICPTGYDCVAGACMYRQSETVFLGFACDPTLTCQFGRCIDGICPWPPAGASCTDASQCEAGCMDGACLPAPRARDGEACDRWAGGGCDAGLTCVPSRYDSFRALDWICRPSCSAP